MRTISIIAFLLISMGLSALHIVGGEMTYEHIGGNSYEVTLIVYRDCNTSGGQLDDPAIIGVFDGNNSFYSTFSFFGPAISIVSSDVDFDCQDISAQVCVQRGFYQGIIDLPDNATGYHLVYQRCCRNSSIVNINNPDEWGSTYTTFIPPVDTYGNNSSPTFNSLPPVGICRNVDLVYDNSATDLDGDSLAYKFCTPYHGGSDGVPIPNPPTAPPYSTIQWGPGFNVNNQMTATPPFELDPITGVLTGTPSQQGQYVIGVCVEEWRDGVMISEVRRDFQFNVVLCPDLVVSSYADLNNGLYCQGLGVQFDNLSVNGTTYFWSFGDGNSSTEENPFHVYSEGGIYDVMLVTDPGTLCSDTVISIYDISIAPQPSIEELGINCPGGTFDYNLSGPLYNPVSYSWSLPDGAEAGNIGAEDLDGVFFNAPGEYLLSVEVTNEGGCSGADELVVEVIEPPVASMSISDNPCSGLVLDFENTSIGGVSYQWDFGDGVNSTSISPSHTYPDQGEYEVTLTASSPGACPDQITQSVQAYLPLFVELEPISPQCTEGNEFSFDYGGQFSASANIEWTITDTSGTEILFNGSSISFDEAGAYLVRIDLVDGPCEFSDEQFALVINPVQADFESSDGGCVPETAFFQDLTTGGGGLEYHWSFGDGATSDFPSSVNHEYLHAGVHTVSLQVESTYGCISSDEMVKPAYLEVLPTPTSGFLADPPYADINSPFVYFSSETDSLWECSYIIEGAGELAGCQIYHEFPGGGSYDIIHIVTNEFGCEDRITRPYVVRGHSFYAPNAITLNQDEVNDFFKPVITGDLAEYELIVYDRWGNERFKTNDPEMPWVPEYGELGTHAFRVRVRDVFNSPVIYDGYFTVIR